MSGGLNTRTSILDAAASVIVHEGVSRLTLDRVAQQAGLSKGGLLYHFGAKERLIEALLERLITYFDNDIAMFEEAEPGDAPGRRTRAFVRATAEDTGSGAERKQRPLGSEIFAALLAAIASNPALLDPLRRKYEEWQARLELDHLRPERASVIRLAADGLWFTELFQLGSFDPARKKKLIQEMLNLTLDEATSQGAEKR